MRVRWQTLVKCIAGAAALVVGAAAVFAEDSFPTKAIRIVVPAAPGGSLDLTTRLVAEKMAKGLGQPVIVENRPGGSTLLGTRLVRGAAPDGYTLLAQANGFSVLPSLTLDPGYDPLGDFAAIGIMVRSPMILQVSSERGERTLEEFIERAKQEKLTFASSGVGTPPHVCAVQFLQRAGLNMLHIPYKGNGAAIPDVAVGRVSMIFDGYISSIAYVKAGKLKPLGVSSKARIAPLPEISTFIEQNVDFTCNFWLGLLAPKNTPKEVIERLAEEVQSAAADNELKARFSSEGAETSSLSPAQFQEEISREVAEMAKLMSDLKIPKQ